MFDIIAKNLLLEDNFEITFDFLEGDHALEGVWSHAIDIANISTSTDYYYNENTINAFSILLDGVTFTAIEDPVDGYRSIFGKFLINKVKMTNTFNPIKVSIKVETEGDFDGIEIRHKEKIISRIGTDYYDSYYPCFVGGWIPTEDLKLEGADVHYQ